jgi:hypothetical protein
MQEFIEEHVMNVVEFLDLQSLQLQSNYRRFLVFESIIRDGK